MDEQDTREYTVVINHEEQYSIWLAGHSVPDGWWEVGKSGSRQQCLDYVEEHWTDMQPLSLRARMAGDALSPGASSGH